MNTSHVVLISALGCSAPPGSAPTDALADAGAFPDVDPQGPRCADVEPDPGRPCIEGGWFLMPRWSSSAGLDLQNPNLRDPTTPTYLDAFRIDVHEVTHAALAEFFAAVQRGPLPSECGAREGWNVEQPQYVTEVSGWVAGMPPADRLDHPAVCVSREEAMAFCAWRGGRLVDAFEYLRASGVLAPEYRAYPWGDTPPAIGPGGWEALLPDKYLQYAVIGADPDAPDLSTRPAGAETLGGSRDGVRGLAGNVSELLADCEEDLRELDRMGATQLVRPRSPVRAQCEQGQLVGGSNWRSGTYYRDSCGASIFTWDDDFGRVFGSDVNNTVVMGPIREVTAPSGSVRSWRVGFRCAYDL